MPWPYRLWWSGGTATGWWTPSTAGPSRPPSPRPGSSCSPAPATCRRSRPLASCLRRSAEPPPGSVLARRGRLRQQPDQAQVRHGDRGDDHDADGHGVRGTVLGLLAEVDGRDDGRADGRGELLDGTQRATGAAGLGRGHVADRDIVDAGEAGAHAEPENEE